MVAPDRCVPCLRSCISYIGSSAQILIPRVGTRGVGSVVFAIRFAQLTLSGSTFLRSVVAPCVSHAGQRWLPELALAGW